MEIQMIIIPQRDMHGGILLGEEEHDGSNTAHCHGDRGGGGGTGHAPTCADDGELRAQEGDSETLTFGLSRINQEEVADHVQDVDKHVDPQRRLGIAAAAEGGEDHHGGNTEGTAKGADQIIPGGMIDDVGLRAHP